MTLSARVLEGLKEFQRRTAEYAFERLYLVPDSTRRFLIADEVGLGKTLVATGVVAQAIDHLVALGEKRIDIIYICSNLAIARQNIARIKRRLSIDAEPLAERITLLPYRLRTLRHSVNLIALTPGTSFGSARAEGVVEERVILYRMLKQAWGNLGTGSTRIFIGTLRDVSRFRERESRIADRPIEPGIVARFQDAVGGPGSPAHREFVDLRDDHRTSNDEEWRERRRGFIAKLRLLLAHACLDALEPDVVILDEFQRFRDLLSADTESGELAQRLFEYEGTHTQVRTLLMSATPYKMYTLDYETEDDHYRDFLETVRFLGGPEGSVGTLEEGLRRLRSELPLATSGGEVSQVDDAAIARLSELRASIQTELLRVMSRTERRGRSQGGDRMLAVEGMPVDLQVDDIEAYLAARGIAAAVGAPRVMEYWKSAPYLLSFMDRYQLSNRVREVVETEPDGEAATLVRQASPLHLPRRAVQRRREIPGGNGRMRSFLQSLTDSDLHEVLWLPPTLPAHTLGDAFERARSATKRLVFSSWAMVPRAVSVMASYDAERRYIPRAAAAARYRAQLLREAPTAYSLFALVVPSDTLATAGDPIWYPTQGAVELFRAVEERLRPAVAELTRDAPTEGAPQEIWYAVAPLLLDRQTAETLHWLHSPAVTALGDADLLEADLHSWQALRARVLEAASNPASLGRPPHDLLEVMAALATGSPANATLRALRRLAPTSSDDGELKEEAMRASWAFRSFFRGPTADGLLRNVYQPAVPAGTDYWRRVLAYAFEGGLSSVLDEFFYVIRESNGASVGTADVVDTLCEALQLATGRLDVSEWKAGENGVQRGTFAMRQHFARRYASDDQQATEHLDAVRSAFNSPFWPFVLATTSVGQEGLDFHWYCHAVVHWNLPPNPVDLEQREGRVHRYHGHAIRKNIAQAVGAKALELARSAPALGSSVNPWDVAYQLANDGFASDGGLVPHWVFLGGDARIQRYSLVPPLSRDAERLESLRRSLTIYRMVFGQPRQDDLMEFILREVPEAHQDKLATALTIDLSPPSR